jgi:PfaD family protein
MLNGLEFFGQNNLQNQGWQGPVESIAFDAAGVKAKLLNLEQPCYVVRQQGRIGVSNAGSTSSPGAGDAEALLVAPPLALQQLGDPGFLATHGVHYAYAAGSMANGISSAEMVIALGRERILGSFGAGGLLPERIEQGIQRVQQTLPQGPYAFNLIHSPHEQALEQRAVELYLKHGVRTIEASAFIDLTPHVVRYRVAGLSPGPDGRILIGNKILAKVSRREVAARFLGPAPAKTLALLRQQNLISEVQANLAAQVPLADDITVEADSGGHTDNRPLVCILPSIIALRDEMQAQYRYPEQVRIGAAGGIGTPASALGAFMMGAAYVMTGSVNQSCVEAGTSQHVKTLLAQAEMTDVLMAPAADMFELGVKLQVLKRGTLFAMRALKLFELYKNYDSLGQIPLAERHKLEKQIFQRDLDAVWDDCVAFFEQRDPAQIARAADNPRRKMALVFRWYLGLASRWANAGQKGREMDYQIWCGPAMGAFNDWVRGAHLEQPEQRRVADVARHIMTGAAFLYRVQALQTQGLRLPAHCTQYHPAP